MVEVVIFGSHPGPQISTTTSLATKLLEAGLPWPPGLAHKLRIALIQGPGLQLSFRWPHLRLPRATLICPGPQEEAARDPVWRKKRVQETGGHEGTRGSRASACGEKTLSGQSSSLSASSD